MATLEKIRSKSVLLIVIIGVALLAFIVGDALTNSRNLFGDQTTVAKIGGEKIDYTDYQRKREELNQQLEQARKQNPQQFANYDTQLLAQMAIDQLVAEKLLDEAVDRTGIRTSGEQLRYYIMENSQGNQRLGEIMQSLNASGVSASTPQQAYEIIFNPKRHGMTDAQMAPFQRAWLAMEEETKTQIGRATYQRLVYGTVKANDLDKKALYNDYVGASEIAMAYKPYGQLDEKEYPVSDAEIKAVYDAEKGKYSVEEPTKDVSFIAVNIAPSDADRKAARELARKTVAQLRDSSDQVDKGLRKSGVSVERKELRASDITDNAVRNYVTSAPYDSVSLVSESLAGFTVVKMGRRSFELDSIQLNLVQVAGDKLPARVLASLNGGLAVDSLSKVYSADSVMAQTEQWIPLYAAGQGRTQALEAGQLDSLLNAAGRYITLMSTPQGSVLAKVTDRKAPKEILEYTLASYDLKPSTATVTSEREKLEKFLIANNDVKKFNEAAQKAGYNVQKLSLTQSSPAVPRMMGMDRYYPESRQVVRWVMIDGDAGDVSRVYESKDAMAPALYAVAIDAEYDDYVPLSNRDLKEYMTGKARRSKAGDKIVKTVTPKAQSIASAASAMGVQPISDAKVRFGGNAMVRDSKVMGRILGSKPSAKVVVVKGDDGVYAYQVKKLSKENFPFNDSQYEQNYFQLVNPDFGAMLRGSKKFKNNAYKFEAGE